MTIAEFLSYLARPERTRDLATQLAEVYALRGGHAAGSRRCAAGR